MIVVCTLIVTLEKTQDHESQQVHPLWTTSRCVQFPHINSHHCDQPSHDHRWEQNNQTTSQNILYMFRLLLLGDAITFPTTDVTDFWGFHVLCEMLEFWHFLHKHRKGRTHIKIKSVQKLNNLNIDLIQCYISVWYLVSEPLLE